MRTLGLISFLAVFSPAALAQEPRRDGSSSAIGDGRPFGLGVSVGDPTAISGKVYLERRHAVDLALAFASFDGSTDVYSHAVYLWHPNTLAAGPGYELDWHVGGGLVVGDHAGWWLPRDPFDRRVGIGLRAPIGLDLNLAEIPLQVFGDVALETFLAPDTSVDLGAALGLRYYF